MEIERKWLVKDFPKDLYVPLKEIELHQSYLSIDPEIRLHKNIDSLNNKTYFLAYKSDGDLSRIENEISIDKSQYDDLVNIINYPYIKKNFKMYKYELNNQNYILEFSEVDDDWMYAEVEFNSEEDAKQFAFPIPRLVDYEVTYNPLYKMKNYWKRTRGNCKLTKELLNCDLITNLIKSN